MAAKNDIFYVAQFGRLFYCQAWHSMESSNNIYKADTVLYGITEWSLRAHKVLIYVIAGIVIA